MHGYISGIQASQLILNVEWFFVDGNLENSSTCIVSKKVKQFRHVNYRAL